MYLGKKLHGWISWITFFRVKVSFLTANSPVMRTSVLLHDMYVRTVVYVPSSFQGACQAIGYTTYYVLSVA